MLLEAGATDAEDSAVTGQSREMVEHHSRQVNQRKLAAAIIKWEGSGSSITRPDRACWPPRPYGVSASKPDGIAAAPRTGQERYKLTHCTAAPPRSHHHRDARHAMSIGGCGM